jgi:NAD(P)H-dependent FMN reductase
MLKIGIILGSTRPNRNGEQVAKWVLDTASRRDAATFELIDLRDHPLPHLDEPSPVFKNAIDAVEQRLQARRAQPARPGHDARPGHRERQENDRSST